LSSNAGLKYGVENWQVYAAVTASALAMTTNASAGIIYSGIQSQTASVVAVGNSSTGHQARPEVFLHGQSGPGFTLG
jgi:hypothetical protein